MFFSGKQVNYENNALQCIFILIINPKLEPYIDPYPWPNC